MNLKLLPHTINGDIQAIMLDTFEHLRTIESSSFDVEFLLTTRSFFLKANRLLSTTDFLSRGDNQIIVTALRLEIESQTQEPEDSLKFAWMTMIQNLEKSQSQKECNARFAIFVPVIFGFMDCIAD